MTQDYDKDFAKRITQDVKCKCFLNTKVKGIQKSLEIKDAAIFPPPYEIRNISTNTVNKIKEKKNMKKQLYEKTQPISKDDMYQNLEVTHYRNSRTQSPKSNKTLLKAEDTMTMGDIMVNERKKNKKVTFKGQVENSDDENTINGRGKRKNINSYEVNSPQKVQRKSIKLKNKLNDGMKLETNDNINNKVIDKTPIMFQMKAKGKCSGGLCKDDSLCARPLECACAGKNVKNARKCDNNMGFIKSNDACEEGICFDALKNNRTDFVCKCEKRKQKPVIECNASTCKNHAFKVESDNPDSDTTIFKLKHKIHCLCRKYSKKLRAKQNRNTCEYGVCRTVSNEGGDFVCNCVKNLTKTKECSDETCSMTNKLSKMKYNTTTNENDQTGDPFFEVKLNTVDLCIMNSSEILDKVTSLGKNITTKQGPCICPSHVHLMAKYKKQDNTPCAKGFCERAKKNKKTNFTCKCLKKRILHCSEETCQTNKSKKNKHHSLQTRSLPIKKQVPLIEIKLDPADMCVVNAKDIRRKIKLFEIDKAQGDHSCTGGICKENKGRKDVKSVCVCKRDHVPFECTNVSCEIPLPDNNNSTNMKIHNNILCKCNITSDDHSRTIKSNKEPENKIIGSNQSFLSRFCKVCLSKSENWPTQRKRKKRRRPRVFDTSSAAKWCRGLICTQSDINTKNGLKISIEKKHFPTCDCSECKSRNKPNKNRIKPRKDINKDKEEQALSKTTRITNNPKETNIILATTSEENKHIKKKKRCGDVHCTRIGIDQNKNLSNDLCASCACSRERKLKVMKCYSFNCCSFANILRRRVCKVNKEKNREKLNENSGKKCLVHPDDCNRCILYGEKQSNCTCKLSSKVKLFNEKKRFQAKDFKVVSSNIKPENYETTNKDRGVRKQTEFMAWNSNKNRRKSEVSKASSIHELTQSNNVCECLRNHECQCRLLKAKNAKGGKNTKSVKKKVKKPTKPKKDKAKKKNALENKKKKNMYEKKLKESLVSDQKQSKKIKRKEAAERKKEMRKQKQRLKTLQAQSKGKEQMEETSCCADFSLGILKFGVGIVKMLLNIVFKTITQPIITFQYVKMRVKDPVGTYERAKRWWSDKWQLKKLEMGKSMGGSENMTIITDTVKNTAIYNAFANKGTTKQEKKKYNLERMRRKARIRKRDNVALYGCRHMLLTTLRKTPFLWVYHLCPSFYPQCLSLLAFMRSFSNMMLFLLAFVVWTPCILVCELCRAFMCCCLCTR